MRRSPALLSVAAVVAVVILAVFVPSTDAAKPGKWTIPGDFATIQDAVDSPMVLDGDTLQVGPGVFDGALLNKSLSIVGKGRAIIDGGPALRPGLEQGFRLQAGSDGASFSHLTFTGNAALAIFSAAEVDGVVVTQNRFRDGIQVISAWRGSDWTITNNVIRGLRTLCGGGIGILLGDYSGGSVTGNVVSHNRIEGTLQVSPTDCGGYDGSGIVLFADFRGSRAGATELARNRVSHNTVSLVSDTPSLVDVVAVELTDTRDNGALPPVIFDNSVGFNDLRGTVMQIALTPAELAEHNTISRNLGENRGHGVRPAKIFDPGS